MMIEPEEAIAMTCQKGNINTTVSRWKQQMDWSEGYKQRASSNDTTDQTESKSKPKSQSITDVNAVVGAVRPAAIFSIYFDDDSSKRESKRMLSLRTDLR